MVSLIALRPPFKRQVLLGQRVHPRYFQWSGVGHPKPLISTFGSSHASECPKPKHCSFSPNSFSYRGPYFKYRGECRPRCRLNVCMGEGSQILIRFGGLAGCRHCFKDYMSILPLNIFTHQKRWNSYILNRLNKLRKWLIYLSMLFGVDISWYNVFVAKASEIWWKFTLSQVACATHERWKLHRATFVQDQVGYGIGEGSLAFYRVDGCWLPDEAASQAKKVVDVASFKTGHLCKFFILLTHGYLIKLIIIQDIPMDLLIEHWIRTSK